MANDDKIKKSTSVIPNKINSIYTRRRTIFLFNFSDLPNLLKDRHIYVMTKYWIMRVVMSWTILIPTSTRTTSVAMRMSANSIMHMTLSMVKVMDYDEQCMGFILIYSLERQNVVNSNRKRRIS